MANINGTNGNDTLTGTTNDDLINGLAGNDKLYGKGGNDILNGDAGDDYLDIDYGYSTLNGGKGDDTFSFYAELSNYIYSLTTGGGGKDKFVYTISDFGGITITDFGGIGKGSNPSAAVIAELDTLQFTGSEQLTARNLQLTQNGNDLEITFEGVVDSKVVLQNFALENLDNLAQVGNILFDGQTNITDSFDVFNANSTQNTIFNKNTVTFLNDLNNNVNGFDNSDDLINGQGGDDIIDGKSGNDFLRGGTGNNTLNGGAGDDELNVNSSSGDNLLSGGDGNDSLFASYNYDASYSSDLRASGNNTLYGGAGDDYLSVANSTGNNLVFGGAGNDTLIGAGESYDGNAILTGGSGKDKFVFYLGFRSGSTITITDFDGIGKGSNPSAAVIAELDTLQFTGYEGLTARNLLLTQNGNNLEFTFEGWPSSKVVLQNFALENLDNLAQVGNILFNGQTSITDSFDVFNANSTQNTIFNKNTVTFLNDLNNNVNGFDNSDDVINGQGGDDIIDGKSGNDMLRSGAGNNTLIGGTGDDILFVEALTGDNLLSGGDGNDYLSISFGNNTLNGGAGKDSLRADLSSGNNLLSGDDGNDYLSASGFWDYDIASFVYPSSGNNTLNGGAGNDSLRADYSSGNNLLSGDDGNDYLSASGTFLDESYRHSPSGNNTLNGGAGNDSLNIDYSSGDNLLFGGNGNDLFSAIDALGNNTLDGGNGNDILQGGDGNDTLYGGDGNDAFVFNSYNEGLDILYDFNVTNELIQVSAAGFGGKLSTSSLQKSQFTLGTSATTSNQRFIYDFSTGALYFDRDGSASGFTQVKFAQLLPGLSLTENNFVVV